ncbi:hypothetical protein GCM10010387_56500 [Streptomyces inusitatus]|uniref:DUF4199 domain-containing protein n=1 Tax=Streptomyces inusitatus TaxID=68221 RepID=A0A918QJR1_9ACTN|nr:hypothetical protein [Streptomyces inusitatus]GGZ55090.1 hypothetical protein GCM10010387_56500 [Streptomyces inusitatus]
MDDTGAREAGRPASRGARSGTPGQPGIIGIALAAVLAAAFAQGSWQWFSTYIGGTLLVLVLCFYRLPTRTPDTGTGTGTGSAYARNLVAYALVVGLCAAIALAPAMQRWAWLFPMPGTRQECPELGAYEAIRTEAALANLAGRDSAALARARETHSREAVADCLSATTTLWLPVYGAGAALLVGLGAWSLDRARTRRETAATRPNRPSRS